MKRALFLGLFFPAIVGCASTPPPYLAKVNDEPITAQDLKAQFTKRHGGHEKFLAGMVEVNKFVDIVVDQKLLIQEAYRLGLQDNPAIKADVDAFRERTTLEYFLRTEIEEKARPSDAEITEAWEKNTSEVVTARQIVVETKEDAEEIRRGLEGGSDFESAARACSTAPSSVHDGLLPEIGWGAMDPVWENAVLRLSPGELSPVFQTRDGWEVDRLEMRSPVERPELLKARNPIEGILLRRNTERRRKELSDYLDAKYHVAYPVSDRSIASLAALAARDPEAPVATWDGGALPIREFLSKDEIAMLLRFPPVRARAHVEELLQRSLNEALAKRETKERHLENVPEVASKVRSRQEDLMEGALYADHILKDLTVTEEEIRAYFGNHEAELVSPERRRVAHIVVADEEQAKQVKKRLDDGESFADLVKSSSKDVQTAKMGGDLGFITSREVPPEFAAVLSLKEGEVSQPLKSKFGWHLIKVTAIEPSRPTPFAEARGEIEKRIREEKQRERRAYWVSKLRAVATVKVSRAAVKRFIEENAVR